MIRAVLFDLDGTIVDSGPGIMNSVRFSLKSLGFQEASEETLKRFIGPSLMESFTGIIGMDKVTAERAVSLYRECYNGGEIYNLSIYPGVTKTLSFLKNEGYDSVLVTAKPHVMAIRILEKFGLKDYFSYTVGTSLSDTKTDKSILIEKAFRGLKDIGRDYKKDDLVMVGDRRFDIEGALASGIKSIGVSYGYGSFDELQKSGAGFIAKSPLEIMDYVLNM